MSEVRKVDLADATKEELQTVPLNKLKGLVRDRNLKRQIKGFSSMNKETLINALLNHFKQQKRKAKRDLARQRKLELKRLKERKVKPVPFGPVPTTGGQFGKGGRGRRAKPIRELREEMVEEFPLPPPSSVVVEELDDDDDDGQPPLLPAPPTKPDDGDNGGVGNFIGFKQLATRGGSAFGNLALKALGGMLGAEILAGGNGSRTLDFLKKAPLEAVDIATGGYLTRREQIRFEDETDALLSDLRDADLRRTGRTPERMMQRAEQAMRPTGAGVGRPSLDTLTAEERAELDALTRDILEESLTEGVTVSGVLSREEALRQIEEDPSLLPPMRRRRQARPLPPLPLLPFPREEAEILGGDVRLGTIAGRGVPRAKKVSEAQLRARKKGGERLAKLAKARKKKGKK